MILCETSSGTPAVLLLCGTVRMISILQSRLANPPRARKSNLVLCSGGSTCKACKRVGIQHTGIYYIILAVPNRREEGKKGRKGRKGREGLKRKSTEREFRLQHGTIE